MKFYETVLNKKTFLRLEKDRNLHDLADLLVKRDPPARLLISLGIAKIILK